MHVAVLTYHSMNIAGTDYARNDHVALAADLQYLVEQGVMFVPASVLVEILVTGKVPPDLRGRHAVTLTCDDGSDYDFRPILHGRYGQHSGFFNLLRGATRRRWWPFGHRFAHPHMTSFVIASPEARAELDRACLGGRGLWNEDWWPLAVKSGRMQIGNHSWDHRHEALPEPMRPQRMPGSFLAVDSAEEAELQIRKAGAYIHRQAPNPADSLFAYPYGDVPDWLADHWLPREPTTRAAFTTEPLFVTSSTNRYRIPRFVCGHHWRSPEQLQCVVERSGFF